MGRRRDRVTNNVVHALALRQTSYAGRLMRLGMYKKTATNGTRGKETVRISALNGDKSLHELIYERI